VLRIVFIVASVALASACASPDKGFGETSEVHRSEVESGWPLTVDSVLLTCSEGVVSVQVEGRTDVIDVATTTRDVSSRFAEIWAYDESGSNGRMSLKPLIEQGDSLCE
jgi:hypothetical protein